MTSRLHVYFKSFDDKLQINLPDLKLYIPLFQKFIVLLFGCESLVSVQMPANTEAVIDYHKIY